MKHKAYIFSILTLLLILEPSRVRADDNALILQTAAQCLDAAGQARELFQVHQEKAGGELLAAAAELLEKAGAFQEAAQAAKDPKKESRDEFWELVRQRRNLDAALSVSSLRKNKDLKAALSTLDQSIAELKPHF